MTAIAPLENFEIGTLLKTTRSICPSCLEPIPAGVYERDNQVWMDKTCPSHGQYSALLSSDSSTYFQSTPSSENQSCSSSCNCSSGIDQHSCVLLVEITQKCNLTCPTCYAASLPANDTFVSLSEYKTLLDKLIVNNHGDADALQISGGEPTIHSDLLEMIEIAYKKGFKQVYLNTNGIKLSQPDFAKSLANLSNPVSIYLQFDGVSEATYKTLRGNAKLGDVKRKALANCEELGIEVIPIMTLTRGVNDNEIKDFLDISLSSKSVNKVMIQPAIYSGRYINPRRINRLTAADTIALIAEQSGVFKKEDFTPIPCGDPNCFRMALALRTNDGLIPVSRYFPKYDQWKDAATAAKLAPITDTFDSPEALSHALAMSAESDALANLNDDEIDTLLDAIAAVQEQKKEADWQGLFAIGIKPFMDAYTYDQDRIDTCCTHIAAKDGTPISFCQYNAINRPQGNL